MKLNDEIDALESMGVNPYEVLVLPRVLGLVIAMPLLTIVADFMGLAGGGLLSRYLIDLPWPQFFARARGSNRAYDVLGGPRQGAGVRRC